MRVVLVIIALASASLAAQKPIEIDRTVQRVHGTAIMSSDIRQVRLLRLVDPAPGTDDAAQTALENRLLILNEATRGAIAEPRPEQIAARRQAWTSSWPPGTDLQALLQRAGMNDRALDGWFRDDLRIEAYLDQRFSQPDPKRDERIAAWLRDLRSRANLPVRLGPA